MRNSLLKTVVLAAMVVCGSTSTAWSQSADSSQTGGTAGAGNAAASPSQASQGSGSINSAVSALAVASVSAAIAGSAVNVSDNEGVSGKPMSSSSGSSASGRSASGRSASGGSTGSQPTATMGDGRASMGGPGWGSSPGWGATPAISGVSGSTATTLRATQSNAESLSRVEKIASRATAPHAAGGTALGAVQHPLYESNSMNVSRGHAQGVSGNKGKNGEQDSREEQEGTSAKGGGGYSDDFPDSTKNKAVISPSDPANNLLFTFTPVVGGEFPDLANYEFLNPSLHAGVKSGTESEKENPYERIERRLREYEEAANKGQARNNGLKENKLARSKSKDPFVREKPGTGLKGGSASGLTP